MTPVLAGATLLALLALGAGLTLAARQRRNAALPPLLLDEEAHELLPSHLGEDAAVTAVVV